jgi:hypothetical protein
MFGLLYDIIPRRTAKIKRKTKIGQGKLFLATTVHKTVIKNIIFKYHHSMML